MKSDYKHVYRTNRKSGSKSVILNENVWHGQVTIKGKRKEKRFKLERECALWVDKVLIENGMEPVNILKKKFND